MRASEIRFRGLFNTMKSGVAVYRAKDNGEDFIITDINPAGERISRVKKEEIAGKIMTEVFPGLQESRRYNLSISMGCSYYDPENPCSIDELMARADKLMYEQKQNCRIVEAERIQA